MENKRWFQTRAGKIGFSLFFLTLTILFTTAKLGTDETGFEALWNGLHPIGAVLVTLLPVTGCVSFAYFAWKNV